MYVCKKDIFDERQPINEYVSINGRRFNVIGVLEEKGGGQRFGSEDGQIFVPLTTAYYRLTATRTTQGEISVSTINVQSISNGGLEDKTVEDPKEHISDILRFSHRTVEDDFSVTNLQDVINSMSESMQSYAGDFSKIRELVSTDLKEISANKKEIFKTIGESQEALQKMYNNMASMSDLIVSKLKRK